MAPPSRREKVQPEAKTRNSVDEKEVRCSTGKMSLGNGATQTRMGEYLRV
jgi:hypothetical protein